MSIVPVSGGIDSSCLVLPTEYCLAHAHMRGINANGKAWSTNCCSPPLQWLVIGPRLRVAVLVKLALLAEGKWLDAGFSEIRPVAAPGDGSHDFLRMGSCPLFGAGSIVCQVSAEWTPRFGGCYMDHIRIWVSLPGGCQLPGGLQSPGILRYLCGV